MINGNRVLGVIGGVGPMATVDFYKKIIDLTAASCDQDHIHVLIDGYSQIPDRTASILAGDKQPLPFLIDAARRLEASGADLLVIVCNAALKSSGRTSPVSFIFCGILYVTESGSICCIRYVLFWVDDIG